MNLVFIFIFIVCVQIWSIQSRKFSNSLRIIGGQEAYAGQFPSAAAIYKTTADGTYFCTGSVLSNDWIITAGQCVDGATLFTILVGTHKLSGDEATVERLATSEYVLHPDYNPSTLENDIGLIKLRLPIAYTDYIQRVYLPIYNLSTGSSGRGYGWGQTSDDNSELSDTLHHVTLTTVSEQQCRFTYGSQLRENMVCFEGNYNEGTCLGDSGSPILQSYKGIFDMVAAISSFFSANGCESTDPSGYVNVYPYNDWIRSVTGLGS